MKQEWVCSWGVNMNNFWPSFLMSEKRIFLAGGPVCILALCQLDISKCHLGSDRTSIEKMPLADWPVGKPMVHFLG